MRWVDAMGAVDAGVKPLPVGLLLCDSRLARDRGKGSRCQRWRFDTTNRDAREITVA